MIRKERVLPSYKYYRVLFPGASLLIFHIPVVLEKLETTAFTG